MPTVSDTVLAAAVVSQCSPTASDLTLMEIPDLDPVPVQSSLLPRSSQSLVS